jgi:hypothetical protein
MPNPCLRAVIPSQPFRLSSSSSPAISPIADRRPTDCRTPRLRPLLYRGIAIVLLNVSGVVCGRPLRLGQAKSVIKGMWSGADVVRPRVAAKHMPRALMEFIGSGPLRLHARRHPLSWFSRPRLLTVCP